MDRLVEFLHTRYPKPTTDASAHSTARAVVSEGRVLEFGAGVWCVTHSNRHDLKGASSCCNVRSGGSKDSVSKPLKRGRPTENSDAIHHKRRRASDISNLHAFVGHFESDSSGNTVGLLFSSTTLAASRARCCDLDKLNPSVCVQYPVSIIKNPKKKELKKNSQC